MFEVAFKLAIIGKSSQYTVHLTLDNIESFEIESFKIESFFFLKVLPYKNNSTIKVNYNNPTKTGSDIGSFIFLTIYKNSCI